MIEAPGTYDAETCGLIASMPKVLYTSALAAGRLMTAGRSLSNPVPPPAGWPLKAPKMPVVGESDAGPARP